MQEYIHFVTNHWSIFTALILIVIMVIMNELYIAKKKSNELSPQAAINLINHEHALVIDIRDKNDYNRGHIIDAIHVLKDDLLQKKSNKFKDKKLILVCNRGISAADLANKLNHSKEFSQIFVLAGGMHAWQNAELPIVTS